MDHVPRLLVINGPNINLLGMREPGIYGTQTYQDLLDSVAAAATEAGVEVTCFQSNHEGAIVDAIQEARGAIDGIVINPAAYTHTSIAILDALKAVSIPFVEVHISDVASREGFRQVSYIRPHAALIVSGEGIGGYRQAILYLTRLLAHTASIPL